MSSETGNQNSIEEEKLPPVCYQEDALDYDYYEEEDGKGPCKTREQKLRRLEQLDNQACCPWRLGEVYPNVEITIREEFEKMEGKQIIRLKPSKEQIKNTGYRELENHSIDAKKQHEENKHKPEK